jgi:hypothetical protein
LSPRVEEGLSSQRANYQSSSVYEAANMTSDAQTDELTLEEKHQWLRALPKRHPLRRRFASNPDAFPENDETLSVLLNTFRDPLRPRSHEHELVARLLGRLSLTPEQKVTVARCLSAELTNRNSARRKRSLRVYLLSLGQTALASYGIGLLLALYLTTFSYSNEVWDFSGPFSFWTLRFFLQFGTFLWPILLFFALPAALTADAERRKFLKNAAVQTLGLLPHPDSVGALAYAARDKDASIQNAAQKALSATLPTLTHKYYGTLETETIPNLCYVLEEVYATKPDFALVLLQALEKVGDGRAVYTLEHRLFLPPVAVRQEANRILPLLRERKRQEEASSMLLRASSEPATPAVELLRPAAQTRETAPEQLLRAIQAKRE